MTDLFLLFLKEKQFLKAVTPKTIKAYKDSWKAFQTYGKSNLSEQGVKNFMIEMISSGMKPGAANSFGRSMNSYLTWLFENKHIGTHLKVPIQKLEKRVLRTYKTDDAEKIISFVPQLFAEKRMMAILHLLIDTGVRINEALSLTRKDVDLENLIITVYGKGRKERRIPISRECRKILFRWLKNHDHDLVFCSRQGDKLWYDNLRKDFLAILEKVGVAKSEGAFHAWRRYFGKQYIRNGGNVVYLQKSLGHTSLETTKLYVDADEEDLALTHKRASPLEHLKSR